MNRREVTTGLSAAISLAKPLAAAGAPKAEPLPPPRQAGGMPLMSALKARRSTRQFKRDPIPRDILSDLLWAAFGVNRPSGARTAPYWRHIMVIDVYLAMADGVWMFDPAAHALVPYLPTDLRAKTGQQDFVAAAPLNLIYVAHGERMTDVGAQDRRLYASTDSAFIGQNVYLFCASQGLATVVRGAIDYAGLNAALRLPEGQFVTFAQAVGYPA
jgi:nitroreductase